MTEDAAKIRLIMELRQSGIKDTRVLSAIERVPREEFVLGTFVDQAYENTALPIAAYQVSGEYAMLKAACERGWLNERAVVMESLLSIRRDGADVILTYFARDAARWLGDGLRSRQTTGRTNTALSWNRAARCGPACRIVCCGLDRYWKRRS